MNKSFPFLANSILFALGICGIALNLPYLAAICLLAISLLFIWYYGITSELLDDMKDEDRENETEAKNLELSNRIKTLVEGNNQLSTENDSLKQRVAQLVEEKKTIVMPKKKNWYTFPIVSAVPVNINSFLNSYIDNSSVRFEKAGINVEYSCPSGEVQTFLSESALLTICNNVFDNIIKFAPEGTKVFVMVSATEEDSLVIFKNSGRGIPESENGRIFDLNYKGANASYGNGLGLSQVREIIEDFGGGVWGKSTYDTGFALYLQIPKHQIQKEQKGADYE